MISAVNSNVVTMAPIHSHIPDGVWLALTCLNITLYSAMFIFVLSQLVTLRLLRSRFFSPHNNILLHCLVWSTLRLALFSSDFGQPMSPKSREVALILYWIFYSFPVCIQYSMFCIMAHFHFVIYLHAQAIRHRKRLRFFVTFTIGLTLAIFFFVNFFTALLTYKENLISIDHQTVKPTSPTLFHLSFVVVKVLINNISFIGIGVFTAVCICKTAYTGSAQLILHARGTTKSRAIFVVVFVTLFTCSRAVYNILSIASHGKPIKSFGYDWINITDQADFTDLRYGWHYLTFAIVLLIWEYIPTAAMIFFFRVQCPAQCLSLPWTETANQFEEEEVTSSLLYGSQQSINYDSFESKSTSCSVSHGPLRIQQHHRSYSSSRKSSFGSIPNSQFSPLTHDASGRLYHSRSMANNNIPSGYQPYLGAVEESDSINFRNIQRASLHRTFQHNSSHARSQ